MIHSEHDISSGRRGFVALAGGLLALPALASAAAKATPIGPKNRVATRYQTVDVNGAEIFYREAGRKGAPTLLLLHGFPTSSRMFRNLIPLLADRYHVIAPDYPGFGQSAAPARTSFTYSHKHLSEVMEGFVDALAIKRYAMYLMDFGGPIGYRLMLKYPDRVAGIVVQNTPVFGEPTDNPVWAPLLAYWEDNSLQKREAVRAGLSLEAVRAQYLAGVRDPALIDPDTWTIDSALLARPGIDEIMLDLLYDIRSNRAVVADAVRFFRAHQNRIMIATGMNDPLFPGASLRPPADLPGIEFHGIDSGHFALEDHCDEIASLTRRFLARVMPA